jgi:MFS transporter, DHA2 family, multidrug resistance protein
MANQSAQGSATEHGLSGFRLWITAVALAMGAFMQVLDSTIANVSLPTIIGDLGGSSSQGSWVITSFAVANGISVPVTGWLILRFGIVRTFVTSVALFTLFSFLCGFAWDLPSLILFRVLQGACAGPMMPGSQGLLVMAFPPAQRVTALALWSMTTLVAPIFGPILGGYLSDNAHWSWIFLVNVPFGILCCYFTLVNLKSIETPTRKVPIDGFGFMLLAVWVGTLQIMLDTGKDADWFASPAIVVALIVVVVAFIVWLIWETTEKHPIVDLSLFKSANFTIGTFAFCFSYAAFFAGNLMMPLWLQTQMGYTAEMAGLAAAPAGIVAVILTPFAARLSGKIDARILATIAGMFFVASFAMRSHYTPDADFFSIVAPSVVFGVALSGFFLSLMTICLNGIPPAQVGQATALVTFVRLIGAGFATSLATTFWERQATIHQTRIAETAGAQTDPALGAAIATMQDGGASVSEASGMVIQEIVRQAYTLAALDLFRVCMWLTLILLPMVWFARRAVTGQPAARSGDSH